MRRHLKTFSVPASDTVCVNCSRWIQTYIWDGEGMVRSVYGHCCTARGQPRKATGSCDKYQQEGNVQTPFRYGPNNERL